MKIAIGMRLREGPWGGGNQFGHALADYLERQGDETRFDLRDKDLDLILLTEPRSELSVSAFNERDVFHYLSRVNPRALVAHRVNECDERKNSKGVNARLRRANA